MSHHIEQITCAPAQAIPELAVKENTSDQQLLPIHQPASPAPSPNQPTQLSTVSSQPTSRPRLGKIARLPKLYRDMVNRMLRNNCPYRKIVGALDELGITVTERNVSNWKTCGGYAEWCLGEDRAAEHRVLQDNLLQYLRKDDASQLPEVGLQLAATHLSRFLLQPQALQQLVQNPEQYARLTAALCRVAGQIHTLQKYRDDSAKSLGYRHNPERIRRENEQEVEGVREVFSATVTPKRASDPTIPHRNFIPATSPMERPIEPARSEEDSKKRELDFLQYAAQLTTSFSKKSKPSNDS